MGEQLTAQYRRAQSAQLEIVAFGAMLLQAEEAVCTCAHGGRFGDKGTGFKGWLTEYAPTIERTKAYRYRDIAEALVGHLHLKSTEQLRLLTATDTTLDEKLAAKREKLLDLVTEKSVRGIQLELGLRDEVKTRGGHHPKTTDDSQVPTAPAEPAKAPDWCNEAEKVLWAGLTSDEARNAFILWRPMLHEITEQLNDQAHSTLPHLDDRTRDDAIATAEQLLRLLAPGLLRRSA